ncbi:MAG TPA: hypothetical protein VD788_08065 [Candidatus Polarisedimenticolaceae bacterium]|nr:hypothetical protein [Candidatus Polarisedimenticolaceae bacterium]
MEHGPKSIGDQIHCLARLTGAPESFVYQVRALFTRKGISLEDDAAPYRRALEEAFVREECIRIGAEAPAAVSKVVSDDDPAASYRREVNRLRRAQAQLRGRRRRAIPGAAVAFGTSGRSLVTRQQREDLPMVPGPEEPQ